MENGSLAGAEGAGVVPLVRNGEAFPSRQLLTQQNKMMDQMEQVMKKLQSIQSM